MRNMQKLCKFSHVNSAKDRRILGMCEIVGISGIVNSGIWGIFGISEFAQLQNVEFLELWEL
jgi:hypothetical protein